MSNTLRRQRTRPLIAVVVAGLALTLLPTRPSAASPLTVDVYAGGSIANAVKTVASGGDVVVHAGSYPMLSLASLGWTSPVTVRPAGTDVVTLAGVTLYKVSNLTLTGLHSTAVVTVDGGAGVDVTSSDLVGVTVKNGATDVDIADNDIVGGWNGVGISSWNGAPHPRFVRVTANRISGQANDNIQIGIADDVTIEGNVLRDPVMNDNHNDGVQFMGGERLMVRRNRISGQDEAILLQAEAQLGAGTQVSGARVENNVITATRGAGIIVTATTGTTIVNNTIYDTPFASVHLIGSNTTLEVLNNVLQQIWRASGAAAPAMEDFNCVAAGGTGGHDVRTDPGFVDHLDYRLTPTSPCRDLAARAEAPLDDFDGVLRGSLPDAGARELVAG